MNRAFYAPMFEERASRHKSWKEGLLSIESPLKDGTVTVPFLSSRLRCHLPKSTVFAVEAVTNSGTIIHHLSLTEVCLSLVEQSTHLANIPLQPGTLIGSGAGGLGWGGGAALGIKLAKPDSFVCAM